MSPRVQTTLARICLPSAWLRARLSGAWLPGAWLPRSRRFPPSGRQGGRLDRFASAALLASAALVAGACGDEPRLVATFTSEVVQRESCLRVEGDDDERCSRDEVSLTLRVDLVEDALDRVWLIGVPRAGAPGRTLVGTRAAAGGWLFVEEGAQRNLVSGCELRERIQLSLRIDDDADPAAVGGDSCIALVGREIRTIAATAECDEINDPPEASERILRRRWQPALGCEDG